MTPLKRTIVLTAIFGLRAIACAQTQPAEQIIYQSKYDDPQNLEHWSKPQVEANAGRPFMGRFNNSTQSLSLKDLPHHAFVRIHAQLLIFDSWDGSRGDSVGPDQLSIRLGDGRTLLQSTFTLGGKSQSFPDNFRTGDYPALTGAAAHNVAWLPKSTHEWGENGIYPVEFVIPHTAPDLRIDFRGMLIETDPALDNESWGLGEIKVSLLEQAPVKLTAEQAKKLIADLRAEDPAVNNNALLTLVSAGDEALELVASALKAAAPDADHIAALIKQLDDDNYGKREAAQKELQNAGSEALVMIRQALAAGAPPEADSRLRLIIERSARSPATPFDLRMSRALDMIGTKNAKLLRAAFPASFTPDWTNLRGQMGVTSDDEWSILAPRVDRIVALLGGPGATDELRDSMAIDSDLPAMAALRTLLTNRNTPDARLKTALAELRGQQSHPVLKPEFQKASTIVETICARSSPSARRPSSSPPAS